MKGLIGLDLDGTLVEYDHWRGHEHVGKALPGAREFVERLIREGYKPVVCTARDELEPVVKGLRRQDFPPIRVTNAKLPFVIFIDDRVHRFDGDYDKAWEAVTTQKAWWER